LTAESKCKRAHGHDWSPLLANAGRTVIAAKWHLSDIMQGRSAIPPSKSKLHTTYYGTFNRMPP
jgi:hypothetical protein